MADDFDEPQREGGRCDSRQSARGFPPTARRYPTGRKWPKFIERRKKPSLSRKRPCRGTLLNVDFMVKDSKRFADSGGWGYAVFDYDAASDAFKPGTSASV